MNNILWLVVIPNICGFLMGILIWYIMRWGISIDIEQADDWRFKFMDMFESGDIDIESLEVRDAPMVVGFFSLLTEITRE